MAVGVAACYEMVQHGLKFDLPVYNHHVSLDGQHKINRLPAMLSVTSQQTRQGWPILHALLHGAITMIPFAACPALLLFLTCSFVKKLLGAGLDTIFLALVVILPENHKSLSLFSSFFLSSLSLLVSIISFLL